MDTLLGNMNTRVLKEPLGFIRILELPLAILAFAATAGYSAKAVIDYKCTIPPATQPIIGTHELSWGYSFDLSSQTVPSNFCSKTGANVIFPVGTVSQAQFFVFTGVICFLYILLILAVYLLSWPNYENDKRLSIGDFIVTAILAVFWFIGSCAWASGVSTVKGATDSGEILKRLRMPGIAGSYPCNSSEARTIITACGITHNWNYASLNVSLIAGFACVGLWGANLWFIYKETIWYKARAGGASDQPAGGAAGSGGAGGFGGGATGGGGGQAPFR